MRKWGSRACGEAGAITTNDETMAKRTNLGSAIRQINKTARDLFTGTFEAIRKNFHVTFQTLFEGGECDIAGFSGCGNGGFTATRSMERRPAATAD